MVSETLYSCVNAAFNFGKSLYFFLDTYSLSTSFLVCNSLCVFISVLDLCSISLSSSLVHFKNGPVYLTMKTARVFIPSIKFLLYSFVSGSFTRSPEILFLNFLFHRRLFNGVSLQYSKVILGFLFSKLSNFSGLGSSVPSVKYCFSLFISFLFHFPSVYPDSIFLLGIRVSNSFSFFANSSMSSIYIR